MIQLFRLTITLLLFGALSYPSAAAEITHAPEHQFNPPIRHPVPSITNHSIKSIQEKLNELGYALIVNGALSPELVQALSQFQKEHNLKVTGTINAETMKKLSL